MKLRLLKIKDAEAMLEWIIDPEVNSYFRFNTKDFKLENASNFIRKSWVSQSNMHLAIVDDFDNYLGTISLKNIDNINKNAEYAISLIRDARGRNVAKEATDLILYIAFIFLELNKIYFNVLKNNHRAISFYKKYGFHQEGEIREYIDVNDNFIDLELFSFFKKDFIELKLENLDRNIDIDSSFLNDRKSSQSI